jgi:hypothetical protein
MTSRKELHVRRVGASLVATFARAKPPLIWRLDLERNHSFTLGLQGEGEDWELGLTTPKGDFTPVVHFASREDAEEAFESVSLLLGRSRWYWVKNFAIWTGVVTAGLLVFLLLASLGMQIVIHNNMARSQWSNVAPMQAAPVVPPPAAAAPPAPEPANGVPLPADDVLKPPSP